MAKSAVATRDTASLRTLVTRPQSDEPQPLAPDVVARIADLLTDAPVLSGDRSSMLARIMDCESIEDAATLFNGLDSTNDVVGLPLMINGFAVSESSYEDNAASLPFYSTVFATNRDTDAEVVFNTGSAAIQIMLLTANRRDWLPLTAHIERVELENGYHTFNLKLDA